jgi:hypothetical protein
MAAACLTLPSMRPRHWMEWRPGRDGGESGRVHGGSMQTAARLETGNRGFVVMGRRRIEDGQQPGASTRSHGGNGAGYLASFDLGGRVR